MESGGRTIVVAVDNSEVQARSAGRRLKLPTCMGAAGNAAWSSAAQWLACSEASPHPSSSCCPTLAEQRASKHFPPWACLQACERALEWTLQNMYKNGEDELWLLHVM